MSPPPSAKGARRRDPEPSKPHGPGPRLKTCSSSCLSWLHPLRSWSLRQTRGGSMSRKADCYDHAPMERFFHTLKTELIHHRQYATRTEVTRDVFAYIEGFYNRTRRHSAIGYISPIEMELKAA